MEIVRKELTTDEVSPPNVRYNETTDEIEYSPDGGATWYPDPALDPRHADANRFPPRSGATARCDAAANMVARLAAFVDMAISAAGTINLANGLLFLLFFLPGVNVLIALILAIADLLIAIGATAISNAFTQEVYDQILCIFNCNIDTDGQVSADQLANIDAQISSEIGGVAYTVCNLFFQQVGEVGLSNAGAIGDEIGDCGACECLACQTWDFSQYDGGFVYYDESGCGPGTWVDGSGWQPTSSCGGHGRSTNYINISIPSGTVIKRLVFETSTVLENGYVKQLMLTAGTYYDAVGINTSGPFGGVTTWEMDIEYGTPGTSKLFFTYDMSSSSGGFLTRVTLYYTGEAPTFPSGEAC